MSKLQDLKKQADVLGIKYAKNVSIKGLEKLILEHDGSVPEGIEEPIKPLNKSAFPEKIKPKLIYTNKLKKCKGNSSSYQDTPEFFPEYITAKGSINTYSKDFLDHKVRSKSMTKTDGIYKSK